MEVVNRIEPRRMTALDERLVGVRRVGVGDDSVGVASHAHVDVGGHVHEVARARGEPGEPLGAGERSLGLERCLDGMNVEMAGADVVGIALLDALERGDDHLRSRARRAVGLPVVPGRQVHERVGVQRPHVVISGEVTPQIAGGGGVGRVQRAATPCCVGGVAGRNRFDQRALDRTCVGYPGVGCAHGLEHLRHHGRVHRDVDVGAVGERDTPVADRARRIEPRRFAERVDGFLVIEAVCEQQSLVEVALRQRDRGADRAMQLPEVLDQRGGRRGPGVWA